MKMCALILPVYHVQEHGSCPGNPHLSEKTVIENMQAEKSSVQTSVQFMTDGLFTCALSL